jgi:histidinol-phosphate aminotransferase
MKEYHPPLGSRDALRLDFNENTLACSPKVREVLGQVSAGALTRYPEREPVEAIVAAHLGVARGAVGADQRRGRSHSRALRDVSRSGR